MKLRWPGPNETASCIGRMVRPHVQRENRDTAESLAAHASRTEHADSRPHRQRENTFCVSVLSLQSGCQSRNGGLAECGLRRVRDTAEIAGARYSSQPGTAARCHQRRLTEKAADSDGG